MSKRNIGRIREKLADLLTKALTEREKREINVDPEDFWIQEGTYRHVTWDMARWGVNNGRVPFVIHSWDTMSDCVKHGISVDIPYRGDSWEREVTSKRP